MASENIRDLFKKSDLMLMGICVVLAAGFIVLAGLNVVEAGKFLTIDSLFFTAVCLLLALTFVAVPALTMHQRGIHPFRVGDEVSPARAAEHVHFEGGTRMFLNVLLGLLALTVIEVFLAYIHVPLHIMLTLLIGLSLIKAAMIVAYFMHLRFERMSLVLTLVPTVAICICLLFIFFPDSYRAGSLRTTHNPAVPAAEGAPAQEH
ncbi:MAG: cytochrome c oxidase subunit [Acidobacteriota bacterium]|jgi:cytochrome c oxidase subunit 4|nr:cytochrome c oxidase subunit [Acidobacteriota bacterium]